MVDTTGAKEVVLSGGGEWLQREQHIPYKVRQNGRGLRLGLLRGEHKAITDKGGAAEHEHVNKPEPGPAHHEEDNLRGRAVPFKVLCLLGVVLLSCSQ